VTLEALENGKMFASAGFAYGNYNYRLARLAVNVVGTGTRDCSAQNLPTTCQANASIPYTLEHDGPYMVRNALGDLYRAPLFGGRIEHGRALAAEGYITNPVSSADRALIEPYAHSELRGRPLTGHYRLRLWDVAGLAFQNVQDVQLMVDYRYWTPGN
jgi:hypothetical protein